MYVIRLSPSLLRFYTYHLFILQISTTKKQKLTLAFVERIRDNYFDPKSKKQLKDLQIALLEMLALILTPLIEAKPTGNVSNPCSSFQNFVFTPSLLPAISGGGETAD